MLSAPVTAKVLKDLQEKDQFIKSLQLNDKRHSKGKVTWYKNRKGLMYKKSVCTKANTRVKRPIVSATDIA